MQQLTQLIKNASVNDKVSLSSALSIVTPIDQEREETIELLTMLEKQVGMHFGAMIKEHVAKMKGLRFNSIEYHYEKPNGEQ